MSAMPLSSTAARRAAESLYREKSFTLSRPLRWCAGFAVVGATVRLIIASHIKGQHEESRATADQMTIKALERDIQTQQRNAERAKIRDAKRAAAALHAAAAAASST